jgi:tetratricopeptide (TPR) repeat protein
MADVWSTRAVELLIIEAAHAHGEGRYPHALSAAERAVAAAEQLDEPALLVRALLRAASALRLLGDHASALARYTRVLALAEDPAASARLGAPAVAWAIAQAYLDWVVSARSVRGIALRDLFDVLDAADRWLTATGHTDWRSGVLLQRAMVHYRLGETDAAVPLAEEALAAFRPGGPGYSLSTYRYDLGDILCRAGRYGDAEPHYQAILDDPDSTSLARTQAHRGLTTCAAESGDVTAAVRHARMAVRLGEPYGDETMSTALEALVKACRAAGDLDGAWQAATSWLEAAARVGGRELPYFATRGAVDVALDRRDLATAERLLAELDEYAVLMDASTGGETYRVEVEKLRRRLADAAGG